MLRRILSTIFRQWYVQLSFNLSRICRWFRQCWGQFADQHHGMLRENRINWWRWLRGDTYPSHLMLAEPLVECILSHLVQGRGTIQCFTIDPLRFSARQKIEQNICLIKSYGGKSASSLSRRYCKFRKDLLCWKATHHSSTDFELLMHSIGFVQTGDPLRRNNHFIGTSMKIVPILGSIQIEVIDSLSLNQGWNKPVIVFHCQWSILLQTFQTSIDVLLFVGLRIGLILNSRPSCLNPLREIQSCSPWNVWVDQCIWK